MSAEIYQFEDFELDRGAFRRDGRVSLERIPLDLLFLLVERHGQLLTREEILDRIWGKEVFVDVDNSINTAVRKIRQALKDNPESPHFLYTIPGKGYRFEASIVELQPAPAPAQAPPAPTGAPAALSRGTSPALPIESPSPAATPPPTGRIRLWPFWFALVAMLVVAVFLTRPYLRKASSPKATGKVMLAVLPFHNLSGDSNQDYFADGMTEEMITQLGGLDPQHLGVIARTSAMQYKGGPRTPRKSLANLGVAYLLEGSVRRDAGRVRVTAQLIQTSDQTHIWAAALTATSATFSTCSAKSPAHRWQDSAHPFATSGSSPGRRAACQRTGLRSLPRGVASLGPENARKHAARYRRIQPRHLHRRQRPPSVCRCGSRLCSGTGLRREAIRNHAQGSRKRHACACVGRLARRSARDPRLHKSPFRIRLARSGPRVPSRPGTQS